MQLRWEYGLQGVADDSGVIVRVFCIEMVYVSQGSFYAGDGVTSNITGQFESGNTGNPFQISGEGSITLGGTSSSNLSNHNTSGMMYSGEDNDYSTTKTLPASFPKGYNAFYCMKWEITQEQYKDFLNTLTRVQQDTRVPTVISGTSVTNRYVMSNTSTMTNWNGIRCAATLPATGPIPFFCDHDGDDVYNEDVDGQNIPCSMLGDQSCGAYLDWAGLRPMTELEFEKLCRGPLDPVSDEYAWGNTILVPATGSTNPGQPNETVSNAAHCAYGSHANAAGPLRASVFAGNTTGREESGAGYWGIMELSGNLFEYIFQTSTATRRSYTGIHGDGTLATAGLENVTNWDVSGGSPGYRAGGWAYPPTRLRVSDRSFAIHSGGPCSDCGGRCVRTAP